MIPRTLSRRSLLGLLAVASVAAPAAMRAASEPVAAGAAGSAYGGYEATILASWQDYAAQLPAEEVAVALRFDRLMFAVPTEGDVAAPGTCS